MFTNTVDATENVLCLVKLKLLIHNSQLCQTRDVDTKL